HDRETTYSLNNLLVVSHAAKTIYYSFFFYCSATHRPLHSFPTRRSSDLDTLNEAALDVFGSYDQFLGLLSDASARSHLEKLSHSDASTDEVYERVRSLGHTFQQGLNRLFLEENEAGILELTKIYGVF